MKAFVIDRYGTKDGVQLREVPEPQAGSHDVLVEVRATSVNPIDVKIRDGEFRLILPYRVPFVLGHDVAGVVVHAGPAVRAFGPGDEVYAKADKARIGTFAERIAIHEHDLATKPATATMEEVAALPCTPPAKHHPGRHSARLPDPPRRPGSPPSTPPELRKRPSATSSKS